MQSGARLILIDPSATRAEVLARRLRGQGYVVEHTQDAAKGADLALSAPPAAVVADIWMPSISGVQLCRLLKSEPGTAEVPVVLCGDRDEPRNRFWAERAGAAAYVAKGRTGELLRALATAVAASSHEDSFFVQLSGGSLDIRDRIARHLDAALFESVIASELRALASAANFERLFDRLAQLLAQVTRYRWIALATSKPAQLAVHHHPARRETVVAEVSAALGQSPSSTIEDEDAADSELCSEPFVSTIHFAGAPVARFALSPSSEESQNASSLTRVVARELGGAIKIAALVEESQRLAATDSLTGLMNRRAFEEMMRCEIARSMRYEDPLSLVLLDLDHFKQINDKRGHAAGDQVLAALGGLLRQQLRTSDFAGRWGGEEFVIAYTSTDLAGAEVAAERLRHAIVDQVILDPGGARIPVSASIGLAAWQRGERVEGLVGRADAAMYIAKTGGRNRVSVCTQAGPHVSLSSVA